MKSRIFRVSYMAIEDGEILQEDQDIRCDDVRAAIRVAYRNAPEWASAYDLSDDEDGCLLGTSFIEAQPLDVPMREDEEEGYLQLEAEARERS